MFKILMVFLFVLVNIAQAKDFNNCQSCHSVESIDNVHKLSCIECHLPKRLQSQRIESHKLIIKNPSSFEFVKAQCGKCHAKDINDVEQSLHGTLSSCINITRYVWHAQKSIEPVYSTHNTNKLKTLPEPKEIVKKPSDLVDDLLRRKCLRCHLQNNSYPTTGTYRAKGCAACHMEFSLSGRYGGRDKVMFNKAGYSKIHRFYKHPKISSCLACHNNEFVGTDYVGSFPQDYDKSFHSPILKNGYFKKRIFGVGQHHLTADIHFKKGLTCVDCHKKEEVMGDGKIYKNEFDAIKVKCVSCHGSDNSKPSPHLVAQKNGKYVFKSVTGKEFTVAIFNKNLIAHKYHESVSCSACHSLWQYGNFQLNLYLDETKNYKMWKNLIYQEDPYLESFLKRAEIFPNLKPVMPDYIDHKLKKGIWYSGWLARRWSFFTLIKGNDGLYYIARPLFQFRFTYRNSKGNIVFNDIDNMSAIMPYIPHTTSLSGKTCESCHNNEFTLSPNSFLNTAESKFFKGKTLFGRKLSEKEKSRLQSRKYKEVRFKMLMEFAKKVFKSEHF